MNISFSSDFSTKTGAIAVLVSEKNTFFGAAKDLDKKSDGAISRALKSSHFTGEKGQVLVLMAPPGIAASRLVLAGTGSLKDVSERIAQEMGGAIVANLAKSGEANLILNVDIQTNNLDSATLAAHIAFGARLRSYRFDKYRTKDKPEQKPSLKFMTLVCDKSAVAKKVYAGLEAVAEGIHFTRDLVSEPPNILTPIQLSEQCKKLSSLGVKVTILDEKHMKKLGMGALLGVAQGSANPPRLVTMEYKGNPSAKDKRPLAFVGKGVTFDTGGISLKPGAGMENMKYDMAGAGAVIGLLHALATRKAKVNVVGVVGLVENMPSGTAQRPGDIVTTMSGQTAEIINTDAEGRLVLADAIWYAQETFKPQLAVDLATLTGAIVIALGNEMAGIFATDETLAKQLIQAGQVTGELLWRMPLSDAYDRDINSDAADMKNMGSERLASSSTAAHFIKRFVKKETPWAHLDIAGMAWTKKDLTLCPKGATGYGISLLNKFIAENYEA